MMCKKWKKLSDYAAIAIGLISIVANLVISNDSCCAVFGKVAMIISAIACVGYIVYAIWLLLWKRADFDWHLIHGNFLRKVCCLVVLTPSLLAGIVYAITDIESPKELVYQAELYDVKESELPEVLRQRQESPNIFWSTYFHFLDPGNQHMTTTKSGRLCAALIAILGVFLLNGLLVSSIIGWIDRRKEAWTDGSIRYGANTLGKFRYAVVIGANEIASAVIRNLFTTKSKGEINYKCEGHNDYVVLMTQRKADDVRTELASHLTDEQLGKVVIYKGLRDSDKEIKELCLEYATEIYVLGESGPQNQPESYHDAMNMKCVNLIAEQLQESRNEGLIQTTESGNSGRKVCKVMFEYQTTSSIFQFSDISDTIRRNLIFIPFNRYESWARKVIVDGTFEQFEYMPLEGAGLAEDSSEFAHLVIVGMSKMGVAMALETLLQAHYPNSDKARTRITFIDTDADKEMKFFKGRYDTLFELVRSRYIDAASESYDKPWVDPFSAENCRWAHLNGKPESFLDVEVEFIKGELESEGVRECLIAMAADNLARLTVAICLPQTHQAIAASLYMPLEVYKSERLQQIWVYQCESGDIIANLVDNHMSIRYEKIRPFGMMYGEYMSDRSLYLKAMLVNVAYDVATKKDAIWPEDISDRMDEGYVQARKSWKKLPVDKMWSNKYCADSIYIKIRNIMKDNSDYASSERVVELLKTDKAKTVKAITEALTAYDKSLSVTEHNRWNVQQLLLGYSPCDRQLDMIFQEINKNGETEEIRSKYSVWRQKNLNDGEFTKDIKTDLKESRLRIHPKICSCEHLSLIDAAAKTYDGIINGAIPKIISIVDGYQKRS